MAAAAFSFSALADASLSFFACVIRSLRLLSFGISSPIFFINDGPELRSVKVPWCEASINLQMRFRTLERRSLKSGVWSA